MKKNLFCIFTMIMLSLMLLTSCGEEKFPYTASSREFLYDGYVYSINENALLTYRKADSSEENPCALIRYANTDTAVRLLHGDVVLKLP